MLAGVKVCKKKMWRAGGGRREKETAEQLNGRERDGRISERKGENGERKNGETRVEKEVQNRVKERESAREKKEKLFPRIQLIQTNSIIARHLPSFSPSGLSV